MKQDKLRAPSTIGAALVLVVFLFAAAVVAALLFRPLYYFDITYLNISARSGLPADLIRQNYDALIDYNLLFFRGELVFPTFPVSATGRIHFAEVKVIFDAVQVLALVFFAGAVVCTVLLVRRRRYAFLKLAAILAVALPLVLGGLIALNWNAFFVAFHNLFFNNDYWIFDAFTDPVITILPDAFFMHCALLILGLVLLGSAAFFLAWRRLRHRAVRRAGTAP